MSNPEVGTPCSFYLDGWRYGVIVRIGKELGMHAEQVQIELPVTLSKDKPRVWVPLHDVNEVGDTVYHGPRLADVVEERAERKAVQQAKADKARKVKRFHR